MGLDRRFVKLLYFVGASIFAASPKANMGGSDGVKASVLSTVEALKSIESAMKGQLYNTALREVQDLIAEINAHPVASVVQVPVAQAPTPAAPPVQPLPQVPPSVVAPISPVVSSPAPIVPVVPAPIISPSVALPDPVAVAVFFPYEAYSVARFNQLKIEINTKLAAPFDVIDDIWKTNPVDCVAQYKAHLDLCVRWVVFYKNLFGAADWTELLGNYFYEKIIATNSALKNPLKLKSWSAGIHGAAYIGVYDYVVARLDELKNGIRVHAVEIETLKATIIAARDNPNIGKSEGNSWW